MENHTCISTCHIPDIGWSWIGYFLCSKLVGRKTSHATLFHRFDQGWILCVMHCPFEETAIIKVIF